jgi:hypothetical protein
MDTATKKAMDIVADQTAQMREEAVGEISDRVSELVNEIGKYISENYIVLDKQTDELVDLSTRILICMIGDDEWYQWQQGMTELLEFNDDVTLDRMQQIVESQHASDEHAPTNQPTQHLRSVPVQPAGIPVGRIQCINVLDALCRTSIAQQVKLRSMIDYLNTVPEAVDQNTAAQEALAIARMKNFVHDQWVPEAKRAHHIFSLLMWAHDSGFADPAVGTIQGMLTGMDLN